VTGTREELSDDAKDGGVEQTLAMERDDGAGLWALLPRLADGSTAQVTWPHQLRGAHHGRR
jgi:hypothetical protein